MGFTQAVSLSGVFNKGFFAHNGVKNGAWKVKQAIGSGVIGGLGALAAGGNRKAFAYGASQGVMSRFLNDLYDSLVYKGNHAYDRISTSNCLDGNSGCTQESLVDSINKKGVHPDQNKTFIPGEEYIADANIPGPFGRDDIKTTATLNTDGTQIGVRNETLENHALHPGVVERTVIKINGHFHIKTQGGGYGPLSGVNNYLKDLVWEPLDKKVFEGLR